MTSLRLILVRHGETRYNLEGRAIGHKQDGLNPRGRLQAHRTAEALISQAPAALYASPISGAMETATIISRRLGIDVIQRDNLKEADVGLLEGLTFQEMQQQYPDFMETWSREASTAVMPGGESILQAQERAWETIDEIQRLHPEETVAVVSHSFILQGLLCRFLGLPLVEFQRLRLDPASITIVEVDQGKPTLVSYNDSCHLEGLEENGEED